MNARFWIRTNELTDGSRTFDVMVRDPHGDSVEFWNANTEQAAEACADAMNLTAGNWL